MELIKACPDNRREKNKCAVIKYNQSEKGKLTRKKYREEHKAIYDKWFSSIKGCLCKRFHEMKQRCNNPKNPAYKHYGGRGVECLFENSQEFIDYVINKLQVDPRKLTVDRINNDGNYEPGNIRFITQSENNKNKRRNCGT